MESISTVRDYDFVLLKTAFLQSINLEFNCDRCLSKYSHRKDGEEMTMKSRQSKGCFGGDSFVHVIPQDKIKFKTCPGNIKDFSLGYIFEAQINYDKGILPFGGSYFDQPNKIMECFNLIHNMRARHELEEMEKKKKKDGKHSRN